MRKNIFALCAGTCLAAFAGAPMAYAQDAAEDEDKDNIVVTGTLIRGIAPVGTETISVT